MPKLVGTLLTNVIPKEHAWKLKLFGHWKAIIGNFRGRVRIEKITRNSITLGVSHATWAQELFMLTPILKQKINTFLQEERIKSIQFKTVRFSQNTSTSPTQEKTKPVPTPVQEHCLTIPEHSQLQSVESPELARALEKFYIRCKQTTKKDR